MVRVPREDHVLRRHEAVEAVPRERVVRAGVLERVCLDDEEVRRAHERAPGREVPELVREEEDVLRAPLGREELEPRHEVAVQLVQLRGLVARRQVRVLVTERVEWDEEKMRRVRITRATLALQEEVMVQNLRWH